MKSKILPGWYNRITHNIVILFFPHSYRCSKRKNRLLSFDNRRLARQKGFEPPTLGLEVRCSIQLSYWRTDVYLRKRWSG